MERDAFIGYINWIMTKFNIGIPNYAAGILFLLLSLYLRRKILKEMLTFHLRRLRSKISLLSLSGSGTFKPVKEIQGVKMAKQPSFCFRGIPSGEFVLRFDYREKRQQALPFREAYFHQWPGPGIMGEPGCFGNNSDSTCFKKMKGKNTRFADFQKKNARQKEKLGSCRTFNELWWSSVQSSTSRVSKNIKAASKPTTMAQNLRSAG